MTELQKTSPPHAIQVVLSNDPPAVLYLGSETQCPTCKGQYFIDFKDGKDPLCVTCEFDRRKVDAVRLLGWNLIRKGNIIVCSHAVK